MMSSYDLIVVGGGIGGSALATVMARAKASVLLLEQSDTFEDRVRGEWIAPWGVAETQRLDLYTGLLRAGGHHLSQHITYDETLDPTEAEATPLPLGGLVKDVPGPLCLRHPLHCQTLLDAAETAGATVKRGVLVHKITAGHHPTVAYEVQGEQFEARAELLIGADGRASQVRQTSGLPLQQDAPHHWFAGLLVEGVEGWRNDLQAIGTEGDFGFLAFPQGEGRMRVYGGYPLSQAHRFRGPDGPQKFLDAFAVACCPNSRHIAAGVPAGPLHSYLNADAWVDRPFDEGVVLIGDAAGWNDPILGLGLSITYRDVRIVSDILKSGQPWRPSAFEAYAEERRERMRRLRFTAKLHAAIDMEFGDEARTRRRSLFERGRADPSLRAHSLAVMAGPECLPAEHFTDEARDRVLGV